MIGGAHASMGEAGRWRRGNAAPDPTSRGALEAQERMARKKIGPAPSAAQPSARMSPSERRQERAEGIAQTLRDVEAIRARLEAYEPLDEWHWFTLANSWQWLREPTKRATLLEAYGAAAEQHLARFSGSAQRSWLLLDMLRQIAPKKRGPIFWRVVAKCWSGCDAIPHGEFAEAFARHRAAWSPDCMAPADRAAWDALPPLATIYRGQDGAACPGLSWTLRRDVAEGFARGHRGITFPSPVILRADVPREAIAFCSTVRDEAEAVLFAAPAAALIAAEALE